MPGNLDEILLAFSQPIKLWSRSEVLCRPCPVPQIAGIYAWYFKEIPPGVPTECCNSHNGLTLLYVGISPAREPKEGQSISQTIRDRIRTHYRGNADSSTLRLSLGCLLGEKLGLTLQENGNAKRLTFGKGEEILSCWMGTNAYVVWQSVESPWIIEEELIHNLIAPLNIQENPNNLFAPTLAALRKKYRLAAKPH